MLSRIRSDGAAPAPASGSFGSITKGGRVAPGTPVKNTLTKSFLPDVGASKTGGYPNGRRVGDDVVDISLRVAAGILLPGNACNGGTTSCNQAPNNVLGDGVNENDRPYRLTFPYLASPWSGYEVPYHGRTGSPDTVSPGMIMATPRP